MAEEIRHTETLTDEERRRLFGWGEDPFDTAQLNLSWRPKDLHLVLLSEGNLVCHAGLLKHGILVDGEPTIVGGVGSVVTVPEAQKRGFARRLMQYTASFLEREWKVEAGLLFCLPKMVAYYEALGWRRVESPVLIERPDGKRASPVPVMVLPFGGKAWPPGSIELQSLPW